MAIATGAAIALGAAALGSAGLQARAAGKGAAAQERASREAMAYQREQDKIKSARYDADKARYDQQYSAWYEARRQGLAQQGINIPALVTPAQTSARGGGSRGPTTYAPGMDGQPSPTAPWSPGAAMPGAPAAAPPGGTLGEIAAGGGGGGAFNLYDSQQGPGATTGAMQPPPGGGTLGDIVGGVDWTDWRNHAPR